MGRTCVCGADALKVDVKAKQMTTKDGTTVSEGDVISIDGTTGEVFLGEVPVVDSRWCAGSRAGRRRGGDAGRPVRRPSSCRPWPG